METNYVPFAQEELIVTPDTAGSIGPLATLFQNGWVLCLRNSQECAKVIRTLLRALRPVKIEARILCPISSDQARNNTLSFMHGLDDFPPHTDYAYTNVPPHYLIFRSRQPRSATTILYDTKTVPPRIPKHGLFHLRTKKQSFYTRFQEKVGNSSMVRFNPAIMKPIDKDSLKLQEYLLNHLPPSVAINWREHSLAVIDNWRFLHARSSAVEGDSPIQRIAIWSKE